MSLKYRPNCTGAPCGAYAPSQRVQQRRLAVQRSQAAYQRSGYSSSQQQRYNTCVHASDATAAATVVAPPAPTDQASPLVYSGVVFDMDGTLTISNIDYVTMRKQTGIPVGDLFTVRPACWLPLASLADAFLGRLVIRRSPSRPCVHPNPSLPQVMESWDDGDRIKRSMDAILELEAQVRTPPGCRPLAGCYALHVH